MNIETRPVPPLDPAFQLSPERLLARRNAKWSQYAPDVIPAYVADMDFMVAPQIQAAIRASVDVADYGYPMRNGEKADRAVAHAFVRRMQRLYGWQPDADLTLVLSDLVQATYAGVMAFSRPGEGVIVQVPNYPPFRTAVEDTGRRLVPLEMTVQPGGGYGFDLASLEGQLEGVSVLVLCNPQNPTGRAFRREELEELLAFAEAHDLTVLSDEIHCDLIFDGARHIPFAGLPGAAARTVTFNSATKGFNIPGLRTAVMNFGTPELLARFREGFPGRVMGSPNALGIDATVAAWDEAQDWLAALVAHLQAMRDHLAARLAAELPEISMQRPEATYLAWLDCRALGLDRPAFDVFHDEARIAFSPGANFLPGAEGFVRLNFATSQPILDEILDRMVRMVRRNR
ncbi:aminotransferase class I/II-fold pyridoxal phosphate-dependent enzyme [Pseudooceanicola sp. GBMRC 2024]|uniref:cysteine-S-conjugate beta-lyase n=1 Tax=Pseudooceanicola albus TaxID=2692189 RepID=A0A6L7G0N8_9RHOB|nr:aminotransferase class I/II-fold pyridoxal phosphate-dependent enzyme [Pseudooceanicola albus]MXN17894.1 aminotransferase class I/II-fold pyridoxal phosphate-dependent enzyme [Pseudooceanicola albus]